MDTSAWKLDDTAWVVERERNWPEFLKFVKSHMSDDANPSEYLRRAEDFYFKGIVKGDYDDWVVRLHVYDYFAMHPSLNVKAASDIIAFYESAGSKTRGYFGGYYGLSKVLVPLFEKGLIDPSVGEIIIDASYGKSYQEAAVLRGFDPKQEAFSVVRSLLKELSSWMSPPPDYKWFPAKRIIPFAIGALEYFKSEDLEENGFYINKLSKRISRLDDNKIKQFPELLEFAEAFKKALEESNAIEEIKSQFR